MPLSKAKDKARKRIERAQKVYPNTKLVVQPKSNLNPVQPLLRPYSKEAQLVDSQRR